ncbi:MAG: sodium:proline symporter, partial [Oscillospiraceae bacterium]|nr:sodium:proline symporter [Oscillospiraceae bacterium]
NIKDIPGFVAFFGMASPVTGADGKQLINLLGKPLFGDRAGYGWLTVLSTMSWGLGYFGMPQVLLRFMAIRKTKELSRSRRIAMVWCVISMAAAVFIGLLGRTLPSIATHDALLTASGAENVFIQLSSLLFHPIVAGIVMAGILAAAMSSSDSYLLIASSAVSKNIWQGLFRKKATEKEVMWVSRIALLAIALFGVVVAWNKNSKIFDIVSFAWAGFGATFGPLVLFSLFWKRTTKWGALAGMLGGGGMVFFYKLFIRVHFSETIFNIYELLPAFLFSCVLICAVSLLTKRPEQAVLDEFETVKTASDDEIEAAVQA